MPVSKLKNIAILILLVTNIILLAFLVPQRLGEEARTQELKTSLSKLYDSAGIGLHTGDIPATRTLYALQLTGGASAQVQAATALLGDQPTAESDPAGWLGSFTAKGGTCHFGREGALEARLQGLDKSAQQVLEDMGATWTGLTKSAGTVRATQTVLGVPVFSQGLEFTYENGLLTAVDGTFFCGADAPVRISQEACMSAADALVLFLDCRFDLGWVGTKMLSLEQGYLQRDTASASNVQLTPVWKLTTDTDSFYLDGLTGEVWSIPQ